MDDVDSEKVLHCNSHLLIYQGFGRWKNPNGDYYEGKFVYDARHGQGTYRWRNGNEYNGDFQEDKRQGKIYEAAFVEILSIKRINVEIQQNQEKASSTLRTGMSMKVISSMVFLKDEDDINSKVVSMRVIGPVGDTMAKVCTTKDPMRRMSERWLTLLYLVLNYFHRIFIVF